jgi:hypothetical protein
VHGHTPYGGHLLERSHFGHGPSQNRVLQLLKGWSESDQEILKLRVLFEKRRTLVDGKIGNSHSSFSFPGITTSIFELLAVDHTALFVRPITYTYL